MNTTNQTRKHRGKPSKRDFRSTYRYAMACLAHSILENQEKHSRLDVLVARRVLLD